MVVDVDLIEKPSIKTLSYGDTVLLSQGLKVLWTEACLGDYGMPVYGWELCKVKAGGC